MAYTSGLLDGTGANLDHGRAGELKERAQLYVYGIPCCRHPEARYSFVTNTFMKFVFGLFSLAIPFISFNFVFGFFCFHSASVVSPAYNVSTSIAPAIQINIVRNVTLPETARRIASNLVNRSKLIK